MSWSHTIYLKFDNEDQFRSALPAEWIDNEGNTITSSHHHALDIIGEIHIPDVLDEAGEVVQKGIIIEGYHANLRVVGEIPASLEQYAVEVNTPVRDFSNGR